MSSSDTVTVIEKWKRWERTLTSSRIYSNPFFTHDLKVTYTSPTWKTYSVYGFWDGGPTFRIRFMSNEIGIWNWKTTFSDTDNSGLQIEAEVSMLQPTVAIIPYIDMAI